MSFHLASIASAQVGTNTISCVGPAPGNQASNLHFTSSAPPTLGIYNGSFVGYFPLADFAQMSEDISGQSLTVNIYGDAIEGYPGYYKNLYYTT